MKDISTYIKESKKLSEDEYRNIVKEAIYEYMESDPDKAIEELKKYDWDMDIILDSINSGKLPEASKLIDAIRAYLDDYFSRDADEYYNEIVYNLDKYID